MNGQKLDKKKKIAKKFISVIGLDRQIDSILTKKELVILNNATNFFNDRKIDINIKQDLAYFNTNVKKQFAFIKKTVYNQVVFKYQNYNQKRLKKLIKQLKITNNYSNIMEVKQAKKTARLAIKKEFDEFNSYSLNSILDYIYKKRAAIELIIKRNDTIVMPNEIDLKVYVIIKKLKNKRVSLLDDTKSIIYKPYKYNYTDLSGIVIIYKGVEFVYIPDEKIFRLPRKLAELKNPVSQYSFEEIPEWEIDIIETEKSITIKLINIEEFAITKNLK
jgi:deoxycytidine triphosphate deaminase